jgi:photosystem II stability/assembly factor-like uncharacterized protein
LVLLAGTEVDGILRSEDGGRTWAGANPGLLDLTVLALALSPEFARDRIGFAATATGLYRTRNGGKSWRTVELGIENAALQCLSVSPDFAEDRLALAGTESDGLLRSDDAGGHWEPVPALRGRSITAVAFSSRYPAQRRIAAATDLGIALSDDGGRAWRITASRPGSVLTLAFVPHAAGEALVAGLHRDGVARLADDGERWTPANAGLQARLLLGLAFSPAFEVDQTLFAAGPDDGVLVSTDGGRTWNPHLDGPDDPPVFGVAPSPEYARDRTLFAATATGVHRSKDGGASWQAAPTGAEPGVAQAVITGPPVSNGTWPVLAVLANGRLLQSDDRGESWRSLGEPMPGAKAEIVSLALPTPAITRSSSAPAAPVRRRSGAPSTVECAGSAGSSSAAETCCHWPCRPRTPLTRSST